MMLYLMNTIERNKNKIMTTWGCKEQFLLTRYLGMPLFVERLKIQYWNDLIQKIRNKLACWKKKILSYPACVGELERGS